MHEPLFVCAAWRPSSRIERQWLCDCKPRIMANDLKKKCGSGEPELPLCLYAMMENPTSRLYKQLFVRAWCFGVAVGMDSRVKSYNIRILILGLCLHLDAHHWALVGSGAKKQATAQTTVCLYLLLGGSAVSQWNPQGRQ